MNDIVRGGILGEWGDSGGNYGDWGVGSAVYVLQIRFMAG
jgi:hypothetical protein